MIYIYNCVAMTYIQRTMTPPPPRFQLPFYAQRNVFQLTFFLRSPSSIQGAATTIGAGNKVKNLLNQEVR